MNQIFLLMITSRDLLAVLFAWSFVAVPLWANETVPKNLVTNSGFEDIRLGKPADWETTTWSGAPQFELESNFGHSGKHCVKISSIEGADASWSFRLRVKPNTEYQLSAWIKTESLGAGGYGAMINLHEMQMEGKTRALRGNNDWTLVTSQFNSGPRNTLLLNCLFGGWGRATGTAWFDDISVVAIKRESSSPSMTADQAGKLFETSVLPVLEKHCFDCHGGGEKIRAELVLTNRADMLSGGESGPAVDLDDPLESLLLSAVNYESYEMPPSGKLPDKDIENIRRWIENGAPWKGKQFKPQHHSESKSEPQVNAETKKWWSYNQPIRSPIPDTNSDWPLNSIDQFILARLQSQGLNPNPAASRQTLIRRAYYDLIGLPPTPEQVRAFVNDPAPDAYERLIDKLLASKHYGEKWGRHWLDLVRYAESNSYERDGTKPFVWRYRDYVIQSLNQDKPYDQFLMEQLAGDEMPGADAQSLIATGFYRLGKWDDEPVDPNQAWYDDMDDVLATTSQAFLGMTINCARCHDHKIDPVPQSDYYRLLAFFRNVQRYGVRAHETVLRQSARPIVPQSEQQRHAEEVKQHRRKVADNRKALKEIEERVKTDFIPVEHEEFKHEMNRVPLVRKRVGKSIGDQQFTAADADRYQQLFEQMKWLRANRPKQLELALCVTERGDSAPETYVLIRGNANAEGELVEPGFPSVLSPPEPTIISPSNGETTGRRTALAKWITSPDNPLTARVMVNRIWQHHFGRGIVRTSNDFGFQGTPPTHPRLLDWLAHELIDGGWRLKRIHKMIMLSRTYQMSSERRDEAYSIDPVNNLFWRFDMRRLTAEEIRDSILAVNGSLNRDKMFGPSIFPTIEPEVLQGQSRPGENWGKSAPDDLRRRSIYIHIKRSLPVPIMQSFDVADPDTTCPVRFNTVQPTQALTMINSQFINEQAAVFADFVRSSVKDDIARQIEFALSRVLQRQPSKTEIDRGVAFVKQMNEQNHETVDPFQLYCVVALNLNEFLFLD